MSTHQTVTVSVISFFHLAASEFGVFLADEDPKKGVWLESGRTLEYYLLRNGVSGGIIVVHGECHSGNEEPCSKDAVSSSRGHQFMLCEPKTRVAEVYRHVFRRDL